jgi:hypothetical protein
MDGPGCVEAAGLSHGQLAALRYHGGLTLHEAGPLPQCPWRVVATGLPAATRVQLQMQHWQLVATVRRPTDSNDTLRVYRAVRR